MKVEIEVEGIEVPMLGFCSIVGIDEDGEQVQQVGVFGDARLWTLIGLAQAANDEFREQLRGVVYPEDED